MKNFFSSQKKVLTEMAVSKMPEGVKRKRSSQYSGVHNIHIGGEHVATIVGHQVNRRHGGRGVPAHVKVYSVHHNEEDALSSIPHKDHQLHTTTQRSFAGPKTKDDPYGWNNPVVKHVNDPREYHSMDDAIEAVHLTHKNKQEWGDNHDPRERWKHAIKLSQGHDDHEKKTEHYKHALLAAHKLGHDDVTNAIQHHLDAHLAKGTKPSEEKLKQWTHDAHHYTGTTHHHEKRDWSVSPSVVVQKAHTTIDHPEHHDLAVQAHNVYVHGHPEGSRWERERKAGLR